jgi:hypothetical protein
MKLKHAAKTKGGAGVPLNNTRSAVEAAILIAKLSFRGRKWVESVDGPPLRFSRWVAKQ